MKFPFFLIRKLNKSKFFIKKKRILLKKKLNHFEVVQFYDLKEKKKFTSSYSGKTEFFYFNKDKFILSFCEKKKLITWEVLSSRRLKNHCFDPLKIIRCLLDAIFFKLIFVCKNKIYLWDLKFGFFLSFFSFSSDLNFMPVFDEDNGILIIMGQDGYLNFIDLCDKIVLRKISINREWTLFYKIMKLGINPVIFPAKFILFLDKGGVKKGFSKCKFSKIALFQDPNHKSLGYPKNKTMVLRYNGKKVFLNISTRVFVIGSRLYECSFLDSNNMIKI